MSVTVLKWTRSEFSSYGYGFVIWKGSIIQWNDYQMQVFLCHVLLLSVAKITKFGCWTFFELWTIAKGKCPVQLKILGCCKVPLQHFSPWIHKWTLVEAQRVKAPKALKISFFKRPKLTQIVFYLSKILLK